LNGTPGDYIRWLCGMSDEFLLQIGGKGRICPIKDADLYSRDIDLMEKWEFTLIVLGIFFLYSLGICIFILVHIQ